MTSAFVHWGYTVSQYPLKIIWGIIWGEMIYSMDNISKPVVDDNQKEIIDEIKG